jgi:uncharacterized protein YbjT (DUF2867 family)
MNPPRVLVTGGTGVLGRRVRSAKARWCARIRLTERSAGKTSCARG